jgi:PKD domain/BNR repeat-like domain
VVHPSRFGRVFLVVALGFFSMCVTAQAQVLFSIPTNVSNNKDYSMTPQVAVDAAGNINVVWEDDTATNSNILFSRSNDRGLTYSSPKNLSKSSGYSFNPRIAVDSQGGINVVWVDPTPGNQDIFFSRSTDGGVTFSAPKNLSNDRPDSASPQIAVDAGGNISVVWENDNITFGIFFSHSTDGGVTFSAPVNLATNPTGSYAPQIALGADGSINLVWEDDFNFQSDISFSRSTDKGTTFSAPKNISHNAGNSSSSQIALDASGNIDVVWVDNTPGNFVILFSRSTDKGATFSSAKNISITGNSLAPQIGVDASGNVHVAWQENTPAVFNYDIFFARSLDGGATFSAAQNLSNNPGNSSNPWMTVDASGNINLAWTDTTPGRAKIFFARSLDAGATFSAPQNLSNDSGGSSGVQIAADKNSNLDVVWSDDTPGVNQILFSRYSDPRVVNQPPVANAGADQAVECAGHGGTPVTLNGSASSDPDGDALSFVWTDEANNVVGTTAIVQVTVGMGTHTFTLTVTDAGGLTSKAMTHVTVRDTAPPTLSVSLSPNYLRPPNHKLVQITATVVAGDVCDGKPTVQLVSITSSDPVDSDDIQAVGGGPVPFGTDVRSFLLRAELADNGADRVYTVTYKAKDASGNTTMASAQVEVGKGGSAKRPNKGKRNDKDEDKHEDKDKGDHDRD